MSIEKINLDTLSVVEGLDTQPAVTGKELQKNLMKIRRYLQDI